MFIPGLIRLMMTIYRDYRGRLSLTWRAWAVWCAVYTPFYPLYVIKDSIWTAVWTLRGVVSKREKADTKEAKLIEIIGE